MPLPRPEAIAMLVNAMADAMTEQAAHVTADEIYSACFTLTSRAVSSALKAGVEPEPLREAIAKIYAVLPQENTH